MMKTTPSTRYRIVASCLAALLLAHAPPTLQASARINHEGRILGPPPSVTNAVLFNTPEADAILSAMRIFPVTNPWNEDISRRPVQSNSDAMIAQIIGDLAANRRTLRLFHEMNFVLVPDAQPTVPIDLVDYPEESDPGPYPLPSNLPIETWPSETGSLSLRQWQLDANDDGGDRHAIVVQPGTGFLWEMWQARLIDPGPPASPRWQASNGAKFDLNSNGLRPSGWTSADAAGLPMFPALVRYDECERGMVEHALRLVVKRTRVGPIYPATHQASVGNLSDPNIPAMGQRLRLKANYHIPAEWTKYEKALLLGLKKYGAIVADNGGFFSISATPDDRYPANAFSHLSNLSITNFEVVRTTGPNEGPRSAGAPQAFAGSSFTATVGEPSILQGSVEWTSLPPAIQWKLYSGPGEATFGDPARTNSTVTFSVPGTYTLLLGADDGVHAVAYDAVMVHVTSKIRVSILKTATNTALVSWTGGSPPYILETAPVLSGVEWVAISTNNLPPATVPLAENVSFFRIKGN